MPALCPKQYDLLHIPPGGGGRGVSSPQSSCSFGFEKQKTFSGCFLETYTNYVQN